jgi:hypothetical protein
MHGGRSCSSPRSSLDAGSDWDALVEKRTRDGESASPSSSAHALPLTASERSNALPRYMLAYMGVDNVSACHAKMLHRRQGEEE